MLCLRTYVVLAVAALLVVPVAKAVATQESSDSDSLFGLGTVTRIEIRIEPSEWAKLQPPKDVDWNIGKAMEVLVGDAIAGRDMHSDKSSRPGLAGYMGVDHQYGRADVVIGGDTVAEVGVRYKGNGTFATGFPAGKPSFKIDFNEYHDKLIFRGLKKIHSAGYARLAPGAERAAMLASAIHSCHPAADEWMRDASGDGWFRTRCQD